MNFSSVKPLFLSSLNRISGWRTNRQIVVIESDDWGTIRMPSKEVFERLSSLGIKLNRNPFNKFDTLECNDDFSALYETLLPIKDKKGRNPVITVNLIMGNPDFERIKASGFTEYYYEMFSETLKKYSNHHKVEQLLKEGIFEGILKPQFHGREHVNVQQWMRELRDGNHDLMLAFEMGAFGVEFRTSNHSKRANLMAAFDFDSEQSLSFIHASIKEGLELFKNYFGFQSKSIIAPAAVWHPDTEVFANGLGVKYIQGFIVQKIPTILQEKYKRKYHYLGEKNKIGQRYLVRNCFFEPSTNSDFNWVKSCLSQIQTAFFLRKPAIISMHRINFVGGIEEHNRTMSLKKFKTLLVEIKKRWPNVEFMSSEELGDLIADKSNK